MCVCEAKALFLRGRSPFLVGVLPRHFTIMSNSNNQNCQPEKEETALFYRRNQILSTMYTSHIYERGEC